MLVRTRSVAGIVLLVSSMGLAGCDDDRGRQAAPVAEGGEGESERVCIEGCDPLEQDCEPRMVCLPDMPGFSCQMLPPVEERTPLGLHDPCEAGSQTCNMGLVCLQVPAPGCNDGTGCCVAFCDVYHPQCSDGTSCYPFHEAATMCYPEVGVCIGAL
jgi:hypothetical protein